MEMYKKIAAAIFVATLIGSVIMIVPSLDLLEDIIFENNRDIKLGVMTGYFSGYVVYLLTVFLSEKRSKAIMEYDAAKRLHSFYGRQVYLLLLMCKTACESEEQWFNIIKDTDTESFNDNYFEAMESFNIMAKADTLKVDRRTHEPITWLQYLTLEYQNAYEDFVEILALYNSALGKKMIAIISKLKNNKYMGLYTGKCVDLISQYEGFDNYKYYEVATLQSYSALNDIGYAFKGSNGHPLKEFVELLVEVEKLVSDKSIKSIDWKNIETNSTYAVSKLRDPKVGHIGTARME